MRVFAFAGSVWLSTLFLAGCDKIESVPPVAVIAQAESPTPRKAAKKVKVKSEKAKASTRTSIQINPNL